MHKIEQFSYETRCVACVLKQLKEWLAWTIDTINGFSLLVTSMTTKELKNKTFSKRILCAWLFSP